MQKILIISHNPFSDNLNNGKTLEAIFGGYPKEALSMLFFSDMHPDLEYCSNYFRITDIDIFKNTIFFKKRLFYANHFDKTFPTIVNNKKHLSAFLLKLKYFLQRRPYIRDFIWNFGGWKISPLINWLHKQKLDCVFLVGGPSRFSSSIACYIAKYLRVPLILYLTDDYLIHPLSMTISDKFSQYRIKKTFTKVVSQASLCFAVGELMAKEYTEYFGTIFFPIMNMVSTFPPPISKNPHSNNLIISYFGGLHMNRWKSIVLLGKILKKASFQSQNIKVFIYSKEPSKHIIHEFNRYEIEYKGYLSSNDIQIEMQNSDILLHVESDDKYYRSLTALSISTKIPEYLAMQKCILAIGPDEVASIRLLKDNNIGYTISSELEEFEFERKLKAIIEEKDLREEFSKRGFFYARNNFYAPTIQKKFMSSVEDILKANNKKKCSTTRSY